MARKKLMVVFGTRPEAIKMVPVIKEIEKYPSFFECLVVVSAQHREMLDQVLDIFKIKPDYDLNVMKPNQSLSYVTSDVLVKMESVIMKENPDLMLVHGDTTTSFSAALAAFYQKVPVAHVEAGLRTYDKQFPYPEEVNRQLIDRIADIYYPPTTESAENLLLENIPKENVLVTGNTAIDTIGHTMKLNITTDLLEKIDGSYKWILLTMHRRENQGEPMKQVFSAVKDIIDKFDDVKVVIPMHLSPTVRHSINEELRGYSERIILTEPLGVVEFHHVLEKVFLILTDSGGLQEEAPALNKPVLVLRDKTERPEGVTAGTLKVVGTDKVNLYNEVNYLMTDTKAYEAMAGAENPYGDGKASERIVNHIIDYFKERTTG